MSALCDQKPITHMIMITKNVGTWWRKPSARGTSNHGVVLTFCFLFFFFFFFLEPVVLAIYLSL